MDNKPIDNETILADISEVLRKYCKRIPEISAEEAIRQIREILNEDLNEDLNEAKSISCGTCKYADYYYQQEPCKTCINNSTRDMHYTKWEEA